MYSPRSRHGSSVVKHCWRAATSPHPPSDWGLSPHVLLWPVRCGHLPQPLCCVPHVTQLCAHSDSPAFISGTGCLCTYFPIMVLPPDCRVLIWRHAARLRRAISSDLHEAHLELCLYLDRPPMPVDRFRHCAAPYHPMWGSPGTAHLLDFNRDGIEQDTDHFTSVPAWARFGAFKLNSLDPSGARFWSGAEGVFHELKSSWRPSWRVPLSQLVPEWFDHYEDVHAVL